MNGMCRVSFVIPCYRCSQTIKNVLEEIEMTMQGQEKYEFEVVLVNDCSPDSTWEVLKGLAEEKNYVTCLNLARNFGQHAALMAGFRSVSGDVVVCLDDDGQTPANEVMKLLDALENGADVVYASYEHKQHSAFRNWGSHLNDRMLCHMLDKPKDLFVSSYFAAKRFVIDEVSKYSNSYPYVIGLVLRSTRNIVNVPVKHREREIGTSGYTMKKLVALWLNGFTAFSIKPLRISTAIGAIFAVGSFAYGIYTIIKKLVFPNIAIGFSALMTAIVFIGGMLMLMLGLIGEYIGRIYISINNSPQYVVREEINRQCLSKENTSD